MPDKEKINIKKKKKRVPLSQKPPKIEKSKKIYNRKRYNKLTKEEAV